MATIFYFNTLSLRYLFSSTIFFIVVSRRNRHKAFSQQRLNAMGLSTDQLAKIGSLFPTTPTTYQEPPQGYGEADSYLDILNSHNMKQMCPHGNSIEEFGQAHQKCVKSQYGNEGHRNGTYIQAKQHDPSCIRFNRRTGTKKKYDYFIYLF